MLEIIFKAIKFPFFEAFKLLIITPLNLIPVGVVEILALNDSQNSRPDLREIKANIPGSRKLHLGCAIIAYLRGNIVRKNCGGYGWIRGVYHEDFQEIQKNGHTKLR